MIRAEYEAKKAVGSERAVISKGHETKPPRTYSGQVGFAKLLSDSIGECLTDLLGTHVREAVYDYMERKHHVARDEIPEHLNKLFKLFDETFGLDSSKVIGRMIAKKVYGNLDWEFHPTPKFEFTDYLERIKTRLLREALNQTNTTRGLLR